MKANNNINNNKKNEIEIVIGDESILNISEVNDCMNTLLPKSSSKKQVIIPVNKKKTEKKKEPKREIKLKNINNTKNSIKKHKKN